MATGGVLVLIAFLWPALEPLLFEMLRLRQVGAAQVFKGTLPHGRLRGLDKKRSTIGVSF